MKMKIDLHTHSTASDGVLSPKELVLLAKKQDIEYLALSDHDTVDGLEEAILYSKEVNINFIPSIELSTQHNGETVHVLGYFKDENFKNPDLKNFLNDLKLHREERGRKIVENLKTYFNLDLDYEKIYKEAGGVIARPHLATEIVSKYPQYKWDYIFEKFIGNNSPAFVPNKKLPTTEGIELLKKFNCITSLAHPVLLKKNKIEDMIKLPFDAIEGVYYINTKAVESKLISLAHYNDKLVTCGSDFHGYGRDDSKHGYLGTMSIDKDLFSKFLSYLN